tara:strand:- start:3765 stop:4166 length:402 start_codon:yes stop_codon:yes gene_type:complete
MPLERVSQEFKDVSMTFKYNPLNGDLIALKNANAIARSLKNIVLTGRGEKFFDPEFGSRVSESLFETLDEVTALAIQEEIEYSIVNYEPRVNLLNVIVQPNFDNNEYFVRISYIIIGVDIPPQELEFALLPSR